MISRLTRRPVARGLASIALVLACMTPSRPGLCQSGDDRVYARAAAVEGSKAFSEKRWNDAIDLFKRAESLVHAPPHLLYIARAQVETGKLVEARENYLSIVHEDLKADAPEVFRSAKESAGVELKALEGRLAYVTLTVKGASASEVALTQDGGKIPSAIVGITRPVNPGAHTFEGNAKGLHGTAAVQLKEGERAQVALELVAGGAQPALPPVAAAPVVPASQPADTAPTSPAPAPEAGTASEPGADQGSKTFTPMFIGSLAGFGVGAAGIAIGTIFTLGGASKTSDADKAFNDNKCAQTGCPDQKAQVTDLDNKGKDSKTIGLIGFIAGGVGIATGVTLFILNNNAKKESAGVPTHLALVVGPSSAMLNGTF